MIETLEQRLDSGSHERLTDSRGGRGRKSKFDIVDIYEELLSHRAELGYRPVLYVSSERDLECNLIGMFEWSGSDEFSGEAIPASRAFEGLMRKLD